MKNKIKIICPKHGLFEQKSENHLKGHICKKCSVEQKKLSIDEFIKKSKEIHDDKYDYSLVNYKNSKTKIKIICKKHGIFEQQPSIHLIGQGCKYCANDKKRLSINDFIKKSNQIHNDKYDYSETNYINNYTKVKIICKKHGTFYQSPNYHMLGQGCPNCQISLLEEKIRKLLNENNIKYEQQKKFDNCKNIKNLPFDFYLMKYNICIECNGKQHYKSIKYFGGNKTLNYIKNNDIIKKTFCKKTNIKLCIIKYNDEINDINKLKTILNLC